VVALVVDAQGGSIDFDGDDLARGARHGTPFVDSFLGLAL
jgi:hypothetical protein